jgi:hypothetical protein
MAFNPDRFVVINGVQISKARALREGLIDEKGRIVREAKQPTSEGPGSTRARTSSSVRTGRGGSTKATGKAGSKQPKPATDDTGSTSDDAGDGSSGD